MTDVGFLWVAGGTVLVCIAAVASTIVIFLQRRDSEVSARGIIPLCGGPIMRLSFAESLHPIRFAEAAEEETLAYVNLHLRDLIADSAVVTVQTLRQLLAG